tara:strand:+ start:284 stop:478 length:195 start_codon:yes stop_codon:yes gene_type:complete
MSAIFNSLFNKTERISYRRLLVFASACGLLLVDKLTGDQWVYVAIAYIAGQAMPAAMKAIKANP